jgi:hypothetical protein
MAEQRKKAGPDKGIVETRPFVEYVPAGVRVDPYAGNEPLLDPELAKVRDEEIKALSEVKVTPREEPTIDPDLVKARDEAIRKDAERAKEAGRETRAVAPKGDVKSSQESAPKKSGK